MEKSPKAEWLNSVYCDIALSISTEAAVAIHHLFKGQQITFPVRLFRSEYLKDRIQAEFDGTNIRTLAKEYGYSEKTIRRLIKKT